MATIVKRGPYQWRVMIRKKGQPQISKTFESKSGAEDWAAIKEGEAARTGKIIDQRRAERMTFGEAIRIYLKEETPKHKSWYDEGKRLEKFLRDEQAKLCAYSMALLQPENVEDYRDRRLEKVAPGTVKREINLLHAVIENVRRRLGLTENVVSHVKRPVVRDQRDRRLEGDEEERLLTALNSCRNPYVKATVILAIETGMRRGELLSMKWDDVDLNSRVVRLYDTKNGENRDVPLSSKAIATIEDLPRAIDGRVLATTAYGIKKAWVRTLERAEIKGLRFHDLRHEATSRLFEKGLNVMEVAAITGHRDIQCLKRYTNLRAVDLAKKLG